MSKKPSKKSKKKSEESKEKSNNSKSEDEEKLEHEQNNKPSSEPTNLDLKNLEFQQFMNFKGINVDEDSSPVLERIAGQQAGPRFIPRGIRQTTGSASGTTSNGDETTYLTTSQSENGPTYVGSSEQIYKTPDNVIVEEAGRGPIKQFNVPGQEAFIRHAHAQNFESSGVERISARPERIDMQAVGRENPVEVEKEKYKKYDFSKKSSY